jgi:predicted enzyme involved in methoxymalonyl-ACP biosynthesis
VHLDLWLMSCRVLKREMELAMLDVLAECARARGIQQLIGYYYPTAKNKMVEDHYGQLGFSLDSSTSEGSVWSLNIADYAPRTRHIAILQKAAAANL